MLKTITYTLFAGALALSLPFAEPATAADRAQAEIVSLEGDPIGTAQLTDTPNGVIIDLTISDLTPGVYAFHMHQTGTCVAPFSSAGGHFNPLETDHGFADDGGAHVGDLPNIHVTGEELRVEIFAPDATLRPGEQTSLLDDDGAAFVIHAGADDYKTDPAGAAGERIACGVIISQT